MTHSTLRLGFGLLLLTACSPMLGCSSDSRDAVGDDRGSADESIAGAGAEDDVDIASVDEDLGDDSDGDLDAPPPDDDPGVYLDTDDDGEGEAYDEDAVELAEVGETPLAAKTPKGNNCVKGGYYCGGDKVTGDAKTLYKCNGPGKPSVVQKCSNGCRVNPGRDDSCAPSSASSSGGRAASPVPGKRVTYAYGVRNKRYAAGYHTGQDYATPTGSKAVAVRSGVVRWSNDGGGAYGKWIGLDADNGRTYVYCHLSKRLVTAGTRVKAGQLIARTGATGNVTGPHLHFEDHPKGPFRYGQVRKPAW